MGKKKTKEQFIEQSNLLYNNKYDYSKIEYKDYQETKVCIICPIHGEFWQTPYNHLTRKCSCSKCGNEKKKKTKEQFIEEAKLIHGNKYNYSKFEYKNIDYKSIIICNTCNKEFLQDAYHHTKRKQGCPYCYGNAKRNTESFIEKAKLTQGNKYNYSKVNYINNFTKVKIICNTCKTEFLQRPSSHIQGKGCPNCANNKMIDLNLETEYKNCDYRKEYMDLIYFF